MVRIAIIKMREGDLVDEVRAYLPDNYRVAYANGTETWIAGEDEAGWTLDDYVLPRLASGMFFGKELTYSYE